ncbi:MAG: helix-turn-helix domain-containing protein [Thermodesulfobacteriota bacterium]|jgi:hypothetical protein|nr:MAG: helix-turn-helix domain-containing protein [Thermodesulfobacteriota bacterium]
MKKIVNSSINPAWLRPKAAAAYCGVSERTLRKWLSEGLSYSRVHGVILIRVSELNDFIHNFEVKENQVDRITAEVLRDF